MKCSKCGKAFTEEKVRKAYIELVRTSGGLWTEEEDRIIAETMTQPLKEVYAMLPQRSETAVRMRRVYIRRNGTESNLYCECGEKMDVGFLLKLSKSIYGRRRYKK